MRRMSGNLGYGPEWLSWHCGGVLRENHYYAGHDSAIVYNYTVYNSIDAIVHGTMALLSVVFFGVVLNVLSSIPANRGVILSARNRS